MMLLSFHYAVYQTRFDYIDPKNQRIKFLMAYYVSCYVSC